MHDVSMPDVSAAPTHRLKLSMAEFIALAAALAAVAAMSIDILLPALPAIGRAFGIKDENSRQLVVLVFSMTFALSQLVYGPLTDRYGRRPLLIAGLCLYVCGSLSALFVTDFNGLLCARIGQGVGAAALQVVTMAIIRDCFSGPAMGRVLTFVFTTFMIVPILAPTIGQAIEWAGGWQGIFVFNAIAAALLLVWMSIRLEETLDPANRRALSFSNIFSAVGEIVTNRVTAGYSIASMLTLVALFAYILSVQQIYGELYGLGTLFPLAFGGSSVGIAAAALFGARLVRLFGLRKVAHGALSLFTLSGLSLFIQALFGQPPFWVTFVHLSVCMMAFGVVQGNFNALSLEPLGHIAGIASSLIGVVTTAIGTVLGGFVGQAYDSTVVPIAFAFGFGGLLALFVVLWTERGRLFVNA